MDAGQIVSRAEGSRDRGFKAMTQTPDNTLEALARAMYRDTAEFYELVAPAMGELALGYKILYGPPHPRPPVSFIGYQPGGKAGDALEGEAIGERTGWPTT